MVIRGVQGGEAPPALKVGCRGGGSPPCLFSIVSTIFGNAFRQKWRSTAE